MYSLDNYNINAQVTKWYEYTLANKGITNS